MEVIQMNCKDIQDILPLYAKGNLSEQEKQTVARHLSDCSECREMLNEHTKINSLITSHLSPEMDTIERETMAKIHTHRLFNNKKILRPAIAALTAIVLVATFAGLYFSNIFVSPEAVLAKAYTTTENLRSFRMMDDEYVQWTETSEPFYSWHSEIDYAGDGRLHAIKYAPDGTLTAYSHETVVIGNTVYSTGNVSRPLTPEQLEEVAPSEQNSLKALKVLSNIEVLPDEMVDGVDCYHYTGQVDIEKWLDAGRADLIKLGERINANNAQGVTIDIDQWLKSVEDFWHTRKLTYDFWISKDDYRVRRWKSVDETPPGQSLEPGIAYRSSAVFTYYDFNEKIDVEPPLDSSGALLPGWTVQTIGQ